MYYYAQPKKRLLLRQQIIFQIEEKITYKMNNWDYWGWFKGTKKGERISTQRLPISQINEGYSLPQLECQVGTDFRTTHFLVFLWLNITTHLFQRLFLICPYCGSTLCHEKPQHFPHWSSKRDYACVRTFIMCQHHWTCKIVRII
jgi:hypothetical protein